MSLPRLQSDAGCSAIDWNNWQTSYLRQILLARVYEVAVRPLPLGRNPNLLQLTACRRTCGFFCCVPIEQNRTPPIRPRPMFHCALCSLLTALSIA